MSEVKTYKWMLRKGGKKMRCPRCGELRFVPYVLTEDGKTIATDDAGNAIFGRCDREDNCCYHLYPTKDIHPEAIPMPIRHDEPIIFDPNVLKVSCTDTLFQWVSDMLGELRARILWQAYQVGSLGKDTIFWQIDHNGKVKAGKVMQYGTDGHRIKDEARPYAINWTHKDKRFAGWYEGKEFEQCWFGEHLLERHPNKPVAIVESEKTAIMMAAWSKSHVWLASSGAQGVKSERKAKALAGREVVLVPDHGKWWEWREVAQARGWSIRREIEDAPMFEGCDILDICLEWKRQIATL